MKLKYCAALEGKTTALSLLPDVCTIPAISAAQDTPKTLRVTRPKMQHRWRKGGGTQQTHTRTNRERERDARERLFSKHAQYNMLLLIGFLPPYFDKGQARAGIRSLYVRAALSPRNLFLSRPRIFCAASPAVSRSRLPQRRWTACYSVVSSPVSHLVTRLPNPFLSPGAAQSKLASIISQY